MYDWLLEVIKQNNTMCPATDAYTDVVELCALLQCLGFSVKSLNTSDNNVSQENSARTVIINCQASGLHVVLESASTTCSCPPEASQQNSGIWQVSGIACGQRLDKEFGCSVLGSLPKAHRERLSKELRVIMRCIRENSDIDVDKTNQAKERSAGSDKANKSASMVDIRVSPGTSVHNSGLHLKPDTPPHYRSLDTLTTAKDDHQLPTPGVLQKKPVLTDTSADEGNNYDKTAKRKLMCRRQSTYTISRSRSPPGSDKIRNKTSSPIQQPRAAVLGSLIAAEKTAAGLQQQLANIIDQFDEAEGKDDSSMSSLALDVSKISLLKVTEPVKQQFASSPNLSGLGTVYEDMKKNKLLNKESNSLVPKVTPNKDGVAAKLRRISPSFFKKKSIKTETLKPQDSKTSKLNSLLKSKAVTPKLKSESNPNLSGSKKKYSHIKSTIPRPTPKKE